MRTSLTVSILVFTVLAMGSRTAEAHSSRHGRHGRSNSGCGGTKPPSGAPERVDYEAGCSMRTSGALLLPLGAVFTIVGAGFMASSKHPASTRLLGIADLGIGGSFLMGGAALWGSGQVRMNRANEAYSISVAPPPPGTIGTGLQLGW